MYAIYVCIYVFLLWTVWGHGTTDGGADGRNGIGTAGLNCHE